MRKATLTSFGRCQLPSGLQARQHLLPPGCCTFCGCVRWGVGAASCPRNPNVGQISAMLQDLLLDICLDCLIPNIFVYLFVMKSVLTSHGWVVEFHISFYSISPGPQTPRCLSAIMEDSLSLCTPNHSQCQESTWLHKPDSSQTLGILCGASRRFGHL